MKKKNKLVWRTAVKEVMRTAAELESVKKCKTEAPSFYYRWEHVCAVVNAAMRLAELLEADAEIVEAAAWLHDVKKYEAKEQHPQAGAQFAREFLPKTDFPKKKIEAVAYAIEQHMGLWRDKPLKNLEASILWDADKLTKIGLTAAFHWVGGDLSRAKKHGLTTEEMIEIGRQPDWQDKTVASMHTKPARKAAKSRIKAFRALWDGLDAEYTGADLH